MPVNSLGFSTNGNGSGDSGPPGPQGLSIMSVASTNNVDGSVSLTFTLSDSSTLGPYTLLGSSTALTVGSLRLPSLTASSVLALDSSNNIISSTAPYVTAQQNVYNLYTPVGIEWNNAYMLGASTGQSLLALLSHSSSSLFIVPSFGSASGILARSVLYDISADGGTSSTGSVGVHYFNNSLQVAGATTTQALTATTLNATTSVTTPTLNATTSISTPTLNATTSISTPSLTVSKIGPDGNGSILVQGGVEETILNLLTLQNTINQSYGYTSGTGVSLTLAGESNGENEGMWLTVTTTMVLSFDGISTHFTQPVAQYTSNPRGTYSFDGNVLPATTDSMSLGISGTEWEDIYLKNSAHVSSDPTLKTDLAEPLGLQFLMDLVPKSYRQTKGKRRHQGILADNLYQAGEKNGVPKELNAMWSAQYDKEKNIIPGSQRVRYEELIGPLIKAVQELKVKNDVLETQIKDIIGTKAQ
jgi:hypothetical protein